MDAAMDALSGNDEATKAIIGKEQSAMAGPVAKAQESADSPMPKTPDLKPTPNAPESNFGKDSQDWTTAMAVLSGVVGAFSRQHATTALNSFAAGMKGFKDGSKEAFDQASKQWKDATDAALENNKVLQEKYKDVLNNRALTQSEQFQQVQLIATQYHDVLMAQASEAKNMILMSKIMESQEAAAEKVRLATEKLNDHKATADKSLADHDELSEIADEYLLTGDAQAAKARLGTRETGARNLQAFNQIVNKKMNEQKITAQDLNERRLKYRSDKSEAGKVGTESGGLKMATNLLDKSLPSMISAANKVGLTESTDLNTVYNAIKRHGSSQDLENFSVQLRAAISDYALMTGRGKMTVHSDDEALKILNDSMGITSLNGFVDAAQQERQNVLAGVSASREGLGKGAGDTGTVHWDNLK